MWRTLAMRITSYDVQKVPDSRLLWRSQIRTPYTPNTIYSHTLLICVKTYAWKASSWKVIWRSYILTPYTPTTIFSHPTHPILYSHTLMCARTYLPKAPSWKDLRWSHILTPYTHNTIFSHPTNNVRAEGAPSESSMVESYCHTPHIGYFILTPYWFVSIHICGRRPVGKYILLHLECHSILI